MVATEKCISPNGAHKSVIADFSPIRTPFVRPTSEQDGGEGFFEEAPGDNRGNLMEFSSTEAPLELVPGENFVLVPQFMVTDSDGRRYPTEQELKESLRGFGEHLRSLGARTVASYPTPTREVTKRLGGGQDVVIRVRQVLVINVPNAPTNKV